MPVVDRRVKPLVREGMPIPLQGIGIIVNIRSSERR